MLPAAELPRLRRDPARAGATPLPTRQANAQKQQKPTSLCHVQNPSGRQPPRSSSRRRQGRCESLRAGYPFPSVGPPAPVAQPGRRQRGGSGGGLGRRQRPPPPTPPGAVGALPHAGGSAPCCGPCPSLRSPAPGGALEQNNWCGGGAAHRWSISRARPGPCGLDARCLRGVGWGGVGWGGGISWRGGM